MHKFVSSLTPEQLALLAGMVAPYIQWAAGHFTKFENDHQAVFNWLASFVLPLLGAVAIYLTTNTQFNHLVPIYGTLYATAQIWYFAAVRGWKQYFSVKAPVVNSNF